MGSHSVILICKLNILVIIAPGWLWEKEVVCGISSPFNQTSVSPGQCMKKCREALELITSSTLLMNTSLFPSRKSFKILIIL